MMWEIFAQAAAELGDGNPLNLLLQFGMTSAVMVVTYFFVAYIRHRDAKDERIEERRTAADEKLAMALTELTTSVRRFDHSAVAMARRNEV
jgi:hypothetical protein